MSPIEPPPLNQNRPQKAPGMAVASLVFGIFSILGGIILIFPAILAVVFGHISNAYCKRNKIEAGQGMSLAGLIMGYLSICVIPIVGLMAAMAIPAFQKVRTASQEKVIANNSRMLALGAEQYFLETGKPVARYADIVGPDKYVKHVTVVMGEKYPDSFVKEAPVKVIKPDGSVLIYDPNTGQIAR